VCVLFSLVCLLCWCLHVFVECTITTLGGVVGGRPTTIVYIYIYIYYTSDGPQTAKESSDMYHTRTHHTTRQHRHPDQNCVGRQGTRPSPATRKGERGRNGQRPRGKTKSTKQTHTRTHTQAHTRTHTRTQTHTHTHTHLLWSQKHIKTQTPDLYNFGFRILVISQKHANEI
jgi:hypothetical protein